MASRGSFLGQAEWSYMSGGRTSHPAACAWPPPWKERAAVVGGALRGREFISYREFQGYRKSVRIASTTGLPCRSDAMGEVYTSSLRMLSCFVTRTPQLDGI